MTRFVLLSFAFIGWAFYEMSGGADFEPEPPARIAKYEAEKAARAEAARLAEIARRAEIAEKAVKNETARATVQVASLDPDDTRAVLASTNAAGTLPLTRRNALVSASRPTPETERARVGPAPTDEPSLASAHGSEAPSVLDVAAARPDIRTVHASRVNMRDGPGTSFGILDTLDQGKKVEVLEDASGGWVKLLVPETGKIGWIFEKLLSLPAG